MLDTCVVYFSCFETSHKFFCFHFMRAGTLVFSGGRRSLEYDKIFLYKLFGRSLNVLFHKYLNFLALIGSTTISFSGMSCGRFLKFECYFGQSQ